MFGDQWVCGYFHSLYIGSAGGTVVSRRKVERRSVLGSGLVMVKELCNVTRCWGDSAVVVELWYAMPGIVIVELWR